MKKDAASILARTEYGIRPLQNFCKEGEGCTAVWHVSWCPKDPSYIQPLNQRLWEFIIRFNQTNKIMKKYFIFSVLFLVPFISHASDADIRASVLQTLLTQFVSQVTAIEQIQSQIALAEDKTQFTPLSQNLITQLDFTTKSLSALLNPQSTVTQETTPVLGGIIIEPTQSMPTSKAEILVVQSKGNISSDFPFGQYIFTVTVLDENGKPNASTVDSVGNLDKIVPIVMQVPDTFNDKNLVDERVTNPAGQFVFGYVPKTAGTKNIIFTSGSLSKTFTLEVK